MNFNDNFSQEEDTGKLDLKKITNIEIQNLNFSYNEDKKILKNINLKTGKNDKVAIIGRTGSGKTTLVNLLCRFYDLEDGKIIIKELIIKNIKYKI